MKWGYRKGLVWPPLPTASGEVKVTHWLGHPWGDAKVTQPLRLRYYLHRRESLTASVEVAQTEVFVLDIR
jgi:hypothetical protein